MPTPRSEAARLPGAFVTGTDTGVGKTVVAATIVASLRARGIRAAAVKPVVTGIDQPEPGMPFDDELLAACSDTDPDAVTGARFGPAVSPHLAAELAGVPLDVPGLLASAVTAGRAADAVIVEGVGGLLVPLAPGWDVRAFACELDLPVIVAARPSVGTINHTLLTVEAARRVGLDVRAVVLTPWPADPGPVEHSNLETIARLAELEVACLPRVVALEPDALAAAGEHLQPERWIAAA